MVRWLVRFASEGRFGRAVPGYADWYTKRWLVLYQGTLLGTFCLQGSFWQGCTRVCSLVHQTLIGIPDADWYTFKTPRWDTKERRQGQHRDAKRQIAESGTKTPSDKSPRVTPRRWAANCQGRHRDAKRQIAKGNTETPRNRRGGHEEVKGDTDSSTIRCVNHGGKCPKLDLPSSDLN